jgi:hypothetical protein
VSRALSAADAKEVERLLTKGLDHYGVGEISEAMAAWEAVLALDVGNERATDYIQNADRRKGRSSPEKVAPAGSFHDLVTEGQQLVNRNDLEGALELFSRAEEADLAALELGAAVDLVRSRLLREYRDEIGGRKAVPTLRADVESLKGINLPADAGFMLSLVDGATNNEDLVSLSGMDRFEAVRILRSLLAAGVLEEHG